LAGFCGVDCKPVPLATKTIGIDSSIFGKAPARTTDGNVAPV
jgi:hypothetical protein